MKYEKKRKLNQGRKSPAGWGRSRLLTFICAAVMLASPCTSLAAEPAADGSCPDIVQAVSLEQYIDMTAPSLDSAVFEVNKKTGEITGTDEDLSFRRAFGRSFNSVRGNGSKMVDLIDESDDYQVREETKNRIEVVSKYGLKRILVEGELSETFGADSAVGYDGETILTFASEEDTRQGYEQLRQRYGEENVFLDRLISCEEEQETEGRQAPARVEEMTTGESDAATGESDETSGESDAVTGETEAEEETEASFAGWGTEFMGLDLEKKKFENYDETITIAVLDSGINEGHDIFQDTAISEDSRNFVAGKDPSDYSDDVIKSDGHGTGVCGILAESTPSSVELLVLKVLNDEGAGSTVQMLQALDYAVDCGANIANLSFTFETVDNSSEEAAALTAYLDNRLREVVSHDLLICSSAGNAQADMDTPSKEYYPGESPYVVAVGAIGETYEKAEYSNYGSNLEMVAPGQQILMADIRGTDTYSAKSGTSFSCPYICSCAAYLLMNDYENTPDTLRSYLRQIAEDLGEEGWDRYFGYGMPRFTEDTILTPVELAGPLKVTASSCVYNGSLQVPEITVTYQDELMMSYDVECLTNCVNIGSHKILVTLRGSYAEPIYATKKFKILPEPVSLKASAKGKKISFSWDKSKGVTGYQLQVATKKSFSSYKGYNTTAQSKLVGGLKSGTYYVRVRAYKKIGSKKYNSAWSPVKIIRIKLI